MCRLALTWTTFQFDKLHETASVSGEGDAWATMVSSNTVPMNASVKTLRILFRLHNRDAV